MVKTVLAMHQLHTRQTHTHTAGQGHQLVSVDSSSVWGDLFGELHVEVRLAEGEVRQGEQQVDERLGATRLPHTNCTHTHTHTHTRQTDCSGEPASHARPSASLTRHALHRVHEHGHHPLLPHIQPTHLIQHLHALADRIATRLMLQGPLEQPQQRPQHIRRADAKPSEGLKQLQTPGSGQVGGGQPDARQRQKGRPVERRLMVALGWLIYLCGSSSMAA